MYFKSIEPGSWATDVTERDRRCVTSVSLNNRLLLADPEVLVVLCWRYASDVKGEVDT